MKEQFQPVRNQVPKTAHGAIMEGVAAGIHDPSKTGKIDSLFRESKDELVDLYQKGEALSVSTEEMYSVGYATANILTNRALKCSQGANETLLSPTNTQLLREILTSSVDRNHRLEISLAIGGSEAPPSLRLPAYVDAAMQVANSFFHTLLPVPTVRIFNAYQISTAINGLDPVLAKKQAAEATNLTRSYVQTLYPHLIEHVEITDLTPHELDQDVFEHDADHLLLLLQADPQLMNVQETETTEALKKLRRAALKNYAGKPADVDAIVCGYAASHGQSFRNYGSSEVDGVIKLGGRGEANFDVIQQYLATVHAKKDAIPVVNRRSDGQVQLVSLRTRAGEVPPYYPQMDREGKLELSVESSPEEIPLTTDEIKASYRQRGLLTGTDFDHLSALAQVQMPFFLKDYLASHRNV